MTTKPLVRFGLDNFRDNDSDEKQPQVQQQPTTKPTTREEIIDSSYVDEDWSEFSSSWVGQSIAEADAKEEREEEQEQPERNSRD